MSGEERVLGQIRNLIQNIAVNIDGMEDMVKNQEALDEARKAIDSMLDILDNAASQYNEEIKKQENMQ